MNLDYANTKLIEHVCGGFLTITGFSELNLKLALKHPQPQAENKTAATARQKSHAAFDSGREGDSDSW